VFYEGEEVADEHNGLRRLFAERPDLVAADVAVLLEPTGGWIEAGCQGTIHVRVTFNGARAHSARPWMGVNAVHRAAPTLARIAAHEAPTVTVDASTTRVAPGRAGAAGVANGVVPDRCEIVVNRRYAPACSPDDAVAVTLAMFAGTDEVEVVGASSAARNLTHRSSRSWSPPAISTSGRSQVDRRCPLRSTARGQLRPGRSASPTPPPSASMR
jgi:succinyl-diaminopimelate desuccinylase